jgi:hypothetical protein
MTTLKRTKNNINNNNYRLFRHLNASLLLYSTFISGPESSSSKGEPKVNGGKSVICLDE